MPAEPAWRIGVDTGGTFTDCLGVDPEGGVHRAKVLSSGALRARVGARPSGSEVVLEPPASFVDGFFDGWTLVLGKESAGIKESIGARLDLSETVAAPVGSEVVLQSPEEAAVVAIRWITRTPPGQKLPPVALRLATTRGTNALLERKGAPVALFVTRGFGDLLEIGNQQRPDLFAVDVRRPEPLYSEVVEVEERLDAAGGVVRTLNEAALTVEAERLVSIGLHTAAVAFLHSFRNPEHEEAAARVLAAAGFSHVSRSSELSRRIRIVPRAQTALTDAYLVEIVSGYLDGVSSRLQTGSVHVMTSAGGLVCSGDYRAKDSLLSGPAAGVVGAVAAGRHSSFERILAFDMGGTSTDVSRFDGELELSATTSVGTHRLLSPSVAVQTVAAGGGSICRFDDDSLRVGPESAGAEPGPACYGGGGPLTLTDVNLLLGRLVASRFPFRVDSQAAAARAVEIRADAGRFVPDQDALLDGFLAIANERMAGAIRAISIRRGYDPSQYTLVAFGGAGAQHACAVAEQLAIRRVLIPPDGALLSAAGLVAGRLERRTERQVLEPLAEVGSRLADMFLELKAEVLATLEGEGVAQDRVECGPCSVFLRYLGQESTLSVNWSDRGAGSECSECLESSESAGSIAGAERGLVQQFEELYRDRYGYLPAAGTLEVESLAVSMRSLAGELPAGPPLSWGASGNGSPLSAQRFWNGSSWVEAPVFDRAQLASAESVRGPCLVAEEHTVTVVEERWQARIDDVGGLVLEFES